MINDEDEDITVNTRREIDKKIEEVYRELKKNNSPQNWVFKHWHVIVYLSSVILAVVMLFPRVQVLEEKQYELATKAELRSYIDLTNQKIESIQTGNDGKFQSLREGMTEIKESVKDTNKLILQFLSESKK